MKPYQFVAIITLLSVIAVKADPHEALEIGIGTILVSGWAIWKEQPNE